MESRNVTSPSSTPSHPLRAGPVSTSSVPLSHWRSYSCVSAPPERIPETIPDTPIIRNGTVRFKGYGFVTSWVWLRKTLALTKETLSVHKRENSRASMIINLKDLIKVERTGLKPYCLLIETKDKRFRVSFKNDEELYGWQDDIHSHSPLISFGNPTNFVHQGRVGFDPVTGDLTATPGLWEKLLAKSTLTQKDYAGGFQAVLDMVEPQSRDQDSVQGVKNGDPKTLDPHPSLPWELTSPTAPELTHAPTPENIVSATKPLPQHWQLVPASSTKTTDPLARRLTQFQFFVDKARPADFTHSQKNPLRDDRPPSTGIWQPERRVTRKGREMKVEREGDLEHERSGKERRPEIIPFELSSAASNPPASLGPLYVLTPSLCESLRVGERDLRLTPAIPRNAAETSVTESACGRLITSHELPSLIDEALSKEDGTESIRCLTADDAQELIDAIDEILNTHELLPWVRKNCLRLLYRTCGHHARLPSALAVPVSYDRTGDALYRGGYGDVWKGSCRGGDVAVKVIRTYSSGELQKIIDMFCKEVVAWRFLRHPNVLPLIGVLMSENRFAMVSKWMVNGNINQFVKAHPEVNRFGLLTSVTEGLIYLHDNEMVQGDLKGANILIDETGHACLADFGLLTIISDPANFLSSSWYSQGGTVRWISPELIDPQRFGLEKSRRTISSDCYALGMVIYETISENLPFHEHADLTVFMKVMGGEHPTREAGFPRPLWKVLEQCWAPHPENRPEVGDVLRCLQRVSQRSRHRRIHLLGMIPEMITRV